MPILVIRTLLPLYKKEFKFETLILHYAFVIYQLLISQSQSPLQVIE